MARTDIITSCPHCFCMTHTIKGKCGKCKGIKSDTICPLCNGGGEVEVEDAETGEWVVENCLECSGTGRIGV